MLRNGLVGTLRADDAATFTLDVRVDRRLAKKLKPKQPVAEDTVSLPAPGTQEVAVKLSRTARRKLAGLTKVKLTVTSRATDSAGNAASAIAEIVTLKR